VNNGLYFSLDDASLHSDEKKPPFADHASFELEDNSSEKNLKTQEDDLSEKNTASESDKASGKKSDTDFYFAKDDDSTKEEDSAKDDDESKEDTTDKKISCRTECTPPMDYETCAVPRCDYKLGSIKDLCQYLCHHQKERCEEVCE
jgi:cobalamin biosynthesis protein CobT